MKPHNERRKDPLARYLWGKIFDLEKKINDLDEHTKEFEKTLSDLKKEDQEKHS